MVRHDRRTQTEIFYCRRPLAEPQRPKLISTYVEDGHEVHVYESRGLRSCNWRSWEAML